MSSENSALRRCSRASGLILEIHLTTSAAIHTDITVLEAQLEPINEALDKLYQEFIEALPPYIEKWLRDTTKRKVEERADSVNNAGLEPLRYLKTDLSELIDRLHGLCTQAVGPSTEWPHRRLESSLGSSTNDYKSESHAATCFQKVIANLGDLFAKHGLVESASGNSGGWVSNGQGKYKYIYNTGFNERDFPSLMRYNELLVTQKRHLKQLESKRQELAKAKARELWDDA